MTSDTMQCLICPGDRTVVVTTKPVPEPGPEDVRIRIGGSAICGSDLHKYRQPTGRAGRARIQQADAGTRRGRRGGRGGSRSDPSGRGRPGGDLSPDRLRTLRTLPARRAGFLSRHGGIQLGPRRGERRLRGGAGAQHAAAAGRLRLRGRGAAGVQPGYGLWRGAEGEGVGRHDAGGERAGPGRGCIP